MKKNEEKDSFFGGFEAVVDGLARIERVSPGSSLNPRDDDPGFETITEIGRESGKDYPIVDPEVITGKKETTPKTKEDGLQTQKRQEDAEEEEVVDEVDETETATDNTAATETTDVTDLGEYEQDVVDFFTDKFTKELGWELEDEKKPKSVSEVIDYMKSVVEASSQPQYASDEIQKLNDYVANGGDLRKYYSDVFVNGDLESLDIESENVQKKVLTDNFSRLGYTPEKINKFLARYEDSGTLQEEAEDALESLKVYNAEKAERLLVEQENMRKEQVKTQQKFLKDVYTTIDKTDSIRGIPISVKEKKELNDYIFKPEADGLTKYQKDYAKDYKNLIESAYFTMKGDSLIQKVTQKATSQAAKNLQDKLANKGKRIKDSVTTQGGSSDTLGAWDTVSRQLRRPNF